MRLGDQLALLVEAGDHQPGEVVLGLQVGGELLEDQRQVGARIARVGRSGCRRCRTGSRRCRTPAVGGLGIGALGADQPVHHHGVAVLLADRSSADRARSAALPSRRRPSATADGRAQAVLDRARWRGDTWPRPRPCRRPSRRSAPRSPAPAPGHARPPRASAWRARARAAAIVLLRRPSARRARYSRNGPSWLSPPMRPSCCSAAR